MSRPYKLALFATLVAFAYLASVATRGRVFIEYFRWVTLGAMCVFVLWSPRPQQGSFSGAGVRFAAVLFAGLATLSSVWSFQNSVYTLMRGASIILLVIFVFYSFWPRLRCLRDYVSVLNIFALLAWLTVLACVLVYAFNRQAAVRPFTRAFQGMFGNPNTLGMSYAVLAPAAVARFHLRKGLTRLLLPVILFVFILASESRAGLAGAALGVSAFYAAYYGRRLWIIVILLFIVAAPIASVRQQSSVLDVAEEAFWRGETGFSEYGSGRFGMWMMALERFKSRPFTGYGFGTAGDIYLPNGEPFRWHSSLIQIAVELGIAGVLFFLAPTVYSGFKIAGYHLLEVGDYRVRAAVGGLMGAWLGGAVNAFFESWLFSVGSFTSIIAWMAFAGGVKAVSEAGTLTSEGRGNARPVQGK